MLESKVYINVLIGWISCNMLFNLFMKKTKATESAIECMSTESEKGLKVSQCF